MWNMKNPDTTFNQNYHNNRVVSNYSKKKLKSKLKKSKIKKKDDVMSSKTSKVASIWAYLCLARHISYYVRPKIIVWPGLKGKNFAFGMIRMIGY